MGTITIILLALLIPIGSQPKAESSRIQKFSQEVYPRTVEPVHLKDFQEGENLSPYLEIWEDKKSEIHPQSILQERHPFPQFRINRDSKPGTPQLTPNYGLSDSTFWFRWSILNESEIDEELILKMRYPMLDHIDLFYYDNQGKWVEVRSGRVIPANERNIFYRGGAFRLPIPSQTEQIFLLRVRSESSISVPLNLWTETGFQKITGNEQILQGLFFGAVGVMLFYNLFLFVSLRDRGYLYYVMYLLSFGVFFQMSLNGYTGLYLFDDSGFLPKYLHNKIYIISVITVLPLMRYVLNTKEYFPSMDRIFFYTQFLVAIVFVLEFFLDYTFINSFMDNLSFGIIVSAIWTCIFTIRRGYSTAYYFFFAFLFVMIGGVLTILRSKGLVPVNFFTENSYQMGMGLEVVLMGFALGDRIQVIEKEKKFSHARIESFQEEMKIARKLQKSTLPNEKPNLKGLDLAIEYKPMSYVGGDFYDFYEGENELVILIADVTGHGIPAAFEASMLKVAFSVEKKSGKSPKELMNSINKTLMDSYENQYLTAAIISIDLSSKRMTVANAGHPSLFIHRRVSNEILEIRPKGTLIGLFEDLKIDEETIRLESGDRIVLFTDGLPDCIDPRGTEYFGDNRFQQEILFCKGKPSKQTADYLMERAESWMGKPNPDDDITLILVDIN